MIFFDIDDTLVTHSQSQHEAILLFWEIFKSRLPYAQQEFPAVWDFVMQKHFAVYAAGQISFSEHRLRRIQEIFNSTNLAISEEEATANFHVYLQYYEEKWALFDDVLPCLDALNHRNLGIISNGNGEQQRRKLQKFGIADRFTITVISEEVGVWKPKPEIFLEACRQAAAVPEDCIYIGDNLKLDAQASQEVGMRSFWLNRKHPPMTGNGVSIINSMTELVRLI